MTYTPSALPITRPAKKLGTTSISLKDLVNPVSQLSTEKWFDLVSNSVLADSKPISLRISFSFTPPIPAPYMLQMVQTRPFSKSCFPSVPGMFPHFKSSYFREEAGNDVISIQIRDSVKEEARNNCQSKKEVIGVTTSGETHVLAESSGRGWFLMNSHWWFQVQKKFNEDGHAFGFKGNRKVIVFRGRKLGYEINNGKKQKNEQHLMTAVEFSRKDPYGKAVALLNFKSGIIEIIEESMVLPLIVFAFLLSESSSKEGSGDVTTIVENLTEMNGSLKNYGKSCNNEEKSANQLRKRDNVTNDNEVAAEGAQRMRGQEGFGSCGCSGGVGRDVKSAPTAEPECVTVELKPSVLEVETLRKVR
ncbi:hypothetical protein CRYUN_Cryun30bG0049500 [Craigia yunnanensis]